MKKIYVLLVIVLIISSCNKITKNVENSFYKIGYEMDSLNQIEEKKIEQYFLEINSKKITKNDGENSALVYYSIKKHNRIIDTLINQLKNKQNKNEIVKQFRFLKSDLKNKLNTISEFDTKERIDTLLKPSKDIEILPEFAIITEFKNEKLNASKSAELILSEIKQKIKTQVQTENEIETKNENIKTDFISTIDYSKINKIIQGIWLPKKYLNDIQKTKSAYISSRSIPTISELQIEPKKIKNDSLYVISSFNNHEGYGITIWFENQKGKINIKSKNYDFDFSTTENDTILKLISKDKKSTEYSRISNSKYISDYGGKGYEIVARKIILNGKFKVLDSVKNDLGIVTFNAENGKIENFEFKKYKILTDYNEPTYEGDNVFLFKKEYQNFKSYGIKKEKDTLKLYSKKDYFENDEYGVKLDKIMFYLIKH